MLERGDLSRGEGGGGGGGGCSFYIKNKLNLKYLITKKIINKNVLLSKLEFKLANFNKEFSYF